MIKINTSGDYVQLIYVDPVQESVQQELKSDTDAFECSYDSEGKLYMQFGLMRFENPDPTDFTINGSAVTDAADFISKLNALFTGGGGGGWGTTGTIATLTGDGTVDLNGHDLLFNNGSIGLLYLNVDGSQCSMAASPDGDTRTSFYASAQIGGDVSFLAQATDNIHHLVSIVGNAVTSDIAYTADTHTFNGINDFVDDAAAAAGGVPVNGLYHSMGTVKIRLS